MTPGIHLLHKPVGPTSFSVVQSCMQSFSAGAGRQRAKICHGGTLDPFAHGLLLILVGQATKLFDHLHAVPKVYEATVRWGAETDNGDLHGRITFTGDTSALSPRRLEDALAPFTGWHDQVPPATSAKRIGGERAYEKAHRGETVVLPPSPVYLHDARWLSHDLPGESRLRLTVRGGYYVRALARDLGRRLGCGAHLTTLHRPAIGPWFDPGPDRQVALHGRNLLPWLASRLLSDQEVGDLRRGIDIPLANLLPPDWPLPTGFPAADPLVRGFHLDRLAFLLRPHDRHLRLLTLFPGGL